MYRYLILSLLLLSLTTTHAQTVLNQVEDQINEKTVKGHLTFLASDALKGRDTGSEGLEAAAAYVKSLFISWGIDTIAGMNGYYQDVPFRVFTPPTSATMKIKGQELMLGQDFIVINGDKLQGTSPVVNIGYGSAEEIAVQDLKLKYAVSIAGDGIDENPRNWIELSNEKRKRVAAAGAIGLIEIYQSTTIPWNFLRRISNRSQTSLDNGVENNNLPNLWVGTQDSIVMAGLQTDGSFLNISMDGVKRENFGSANVVGYIPGTDPILKDEYIVYSAHYDHVGIGNADAKGDTIYNGTRDNAVGTTAVLSLAEHFGKYPPKRSSLFVLFTAEEKGLLGSRFFTEHLPVPTEQIKYNFNIDNGGYNDTTIISVIGLTRTEAEADIQAACQALGLTAIEDAAGEQGLFDRSDNVNFARLGIPAPTFSLGFTAFDEEIMKYYHQAGDEVETININYVTKYVKAYILSADRIANGDKAPFWLEGDKYYDKGVELYGK